MMLLKSTEEGEGKYDGLAAQKLEEGIHFNHAATTTQPTGEERWKGMTCSQRGLELRQCSTHLNEATFLASPK